MTQFPTPIPGQDPLSAELRERVRKLQRFLQIRYAGDMKIKTEPHHLVPVSLIREILEAEAALLPAPIPQAEDGFLDELEAAAKKATPGPWFTVFEPVGDDDVGITGYEPSGDFCHSSEAGAHLNLRYEANANYIALANPEAVLRLIAIARAAESDIARFKGELAVLKGGTEEELLAAKEREDLARGYDPAAFHSGFSGDWNSREPRRVAAYARADNELSARAAGGKQ